MFSQNNECNTKGLEIRGLFIELVILTKHVF